MTKFFALAAVVALTQMVHSVQAYYLDCAMNSTNATDCGGVYSNYTNYTRLLEASDEELYDTSEFWNTSCIESALLNNCSDACLQEDALLGDCLSCLDNNRDTFFSCINTTTIDEACFNGASDCVLANCNTTEWDEADTCVNICIANTSSCPAMIFDDGDMDEDLYESTKAEEIISNYTNSSLASNRTDALGSSSVNLTCVEEVVATSCGSCLNATTVDDMDACGDCLDEQDDSFDVCFGSSDCSEDDLVECLLTTCMNSTSWDSTCGYACESLYCDGDGYSTTDSYSTGSERRLRGN
mmetsp:Transcript_6883/g.13721  ORF Transcript_6883/g.13721 Transcript_6883/m.13721 type:complete len:298 (+) Transcript_6883:137-1030(+)|eukprot:CAMPEP_0171488248 /NCGR_PEP_ID=MMETSP0958-20121227/2103_1 /TAXON_ID=87120 /ORGANISM="Aurantiochytrium limacinum, Strain ATCCMYA-1381" /LENGTH=297 /DNA_ID=CAMNT_0012021343 /DNA_START=138 /DNA_END=1031 /DNA_ORIENTATION=-